MNKVKILDTTFENLVESYINARNRAGISIFEMASICLKAKEQLKKKKWFEWLADNRINLKKTQAKKFIAVAKICGQGGQSTDLLNRKGIEETYLITKIEDEKIREDLAGQIIDAEFTVKQTKQVISKVKNESKTPAEAIKEIKNLPKLLVVKTERKTVPIQEFNKLKAEYDKLLKEKQELENSLKKNVNDIQVQKPQTKQESSQNEILKEPVETDLPEDTLNKERHSIVVKGWEIPIPAGVPFDENNPEKMRFSAINNTRNFHKLDLS